MNNALSQITAMPSTLEGVNNFFNKAKKEILSGKYEPLLIEVYLKAIEEIIKKLRTDKDIKDASITEAYKYKEKTFDAFGAKFTIRETGTKYDYANSGDIKWEMLDAQINNLSAKKKERESFLKSLKEPVADVDEGYIINPPFKTSTESISVTLK
jgi:hypothetical protein